jgi:hypothetical protein
MSRFILAAVLAFSVGACGSEPNRLYGSASEIYNLSFDRVQIFSLGGQISIEYQKLSGQDVQSKVAKLTVTVSDLANMAGNDIDLTGTVSGLAKRGTLQRVEPSGTTTFELETGVVHFNQEPNPGTNLSGSFHTTLADPKGRTLNGDFQADVVAQ